VQQPDGLWYVPEGKWLVLYTRKLKKLFTGWYWEGLCLLVYFALTASQLFVRPIIGLADNGDFPKVLGPNSVCDPNGEKDAFAYVYPRYVIRDECFWNSRTLSSEKLVVEILKSAAQAFDRTSFSITGAGKAHLAVLLVALAVLLWSLRESPLALRCGLPVLAMVIFSDVAYVAYLNSFFMDAFSMVFLLLVAALGGAWVLRPRAWVAIAFGIAGVLFGLSKTPHGVAALFLAGLAAWFAVGSLRRRNYLRGGCWAASAIAVAVSGAMSIQAPPGDYKAEPLYSLIFYRLLPGLPDKAQTLAELGLPESDVKYSGTFAYMPNAGLMNEKWKADFLTRINFSRIVTYYLRHPLIALHLVWWGLTQDGPAIRPGYLGNYERADGVARSAQARHFIWWTDLRMWLFRIFPAHVVIFYGIMGIGSCLCIFRGAWAARWPLYPMVLFLTASGIVEFLLGPLLDGVEIARHLFLFHVITEILILCAVAGVLAAIRPRAAIGRC
jgi:hypothetical protein